MKKTLYIHIGHYKTGTTALQVFLDENSGLLANSGFEYPSFNFHNSKHSAYAFAILRDVDVDHLMHGYDDPKPSIVMWEELFHHVRNSPFPNTLISSEEFIRIGEFPEAVIKLAEIAHLATDIDIRIVVYLQEPDAHLRSWYNQLVKMGVRVPDITAALQNEIEAIHSDYGRALAPWSDVFGAEALLVRRYRKNSDAPEALLYDFMSVLGVDVDTITLPPQQDLNPHMDARVVELVRLLQNSGLDQARVGAIQMQALNYLEAQENNSSKNNDCLAEVQSRAQTGIDWLGNCRNSNIDIEEFRKKVPQPALGDAVQNSLILDFLLQNLILKQ